MTITRYLRVTMAAIAAPVWMIAGPVEGNEALAANKPPSVYLRDLGMMGIGAEALRTNDAGVVIGTFVVESDSESPFDNSRAFRWDNGSVTELSRMGNEISVATAINNRGQVAGAVGSLNRMSSQAVRWEPDGNVVPLDAPGQNSHATQINRSGG